MIYLAAYALPKERQCAEPTCGKRYTPWSLTNHFCGEECAWLSRLRRSGQLTEAKEAEVRAVRTSRLEQSRKALEKARAAKAKGIKPDATTGETPPRLVESVPDRTRSRRTKRVHRKRNDQLHARRSNKRKRK